MCSDVVVQDAAPRVFNDEEAIPQFEAQGAPGIPGRTGGAARAESADQNEYSVSQRDQRYLRSQRSGDHHRRPVATVEALLSGQTSTAARPASSQ